MPRSLTLLTPHWRYSYTVFLALLLILWSDYSQAESSLYVGKGPVPEPVQLVESQTNSLLNQLAERREEFTSKPESLVEFARTVALKHWNLTKACRLMLGPFWRQMNKQQRVDFEEEFLRTLLRYVVKAYGYYDEDLIQVQEYRWLTQGRGGWVKSKVKVPGGLAVDVDYRMELEKKTQQWRLIDVRVEGISLLKVKRNEYQDIIARSGIDSLIKDMAEKNQQVLGQLELDQATAH